jgi:hypothetical protein
MSSVRAVLRNSGSREREQGTQLRPEPTGSSRTGQFYFRGYQQEVWGEIITFRVSRDGRVDDPHFIHDLGLDFHLLELLIERHLIG